ncbi:TonB-dependent receptor [Paucibacter sp. Y2R2-4]|uniref:TonB-dependent receptor n=1 Tax=Paucibacter sp. Y2R2-4 TaxID=2893553 RepID=UPI0021E4010B|nr:TonB-dependent receptor [Paucibacter sp. Y2R2-4]MCV2351471.1 TonB-dependent receptor [Paucibacter sp. Y2R2-4]
MMTRTSLASRQQRWSTTPIAAAVGATLLALSAAHAQTAPAENKADSKAEAKTDASQLETVVVTGYRSSIEKSLAQKRDANSVIEVITAEDIGKFPDKNVADALQRVPGVVISRESSGGRPGSEGKSVSVRGLSPELTLTQLNGNFIASGEANSDPSRSFNYALLPASMLGKAELYKSSEARLDEGGVGGTVILHTRRPLDMPSGSAFGNVEGTWSDTTQRFDPQLSGMYSWRSEDKRFGLLGGVTYQKRQDRSLGVSTENFAWWSDKNSNGGLVNKPVDVNGHALPSGSGAWWGGCCTNGMTTQTGQHYSGFWMPTAVGFRDYDQQKERTGAQLTAQLKATDNLTLTANYFNFGLKDDYFLHQAKIAEWDMHVWDWDSPASAKTGRHLKGFTFDPSGTIVTGQQLQRNKPICSNADAAAAGVNPPTGWGETDCVMQTPSFYADIHHQTVKSQTFDFAGEWRSDFIDADFKIGRTQAKADSPLAFNIQINPRSFRNGVPGVGNTDSTWDLTGRPSATFSPQLQQNLMNGISEVDLGGTNSSFTANETWQNYAQVDFTKKLTIDWLDNLQFGLKYRDGGVHRHTGNNFWACPNFVDYDSSKFQSCDSGVGQAAYFQSQPTTNIPGGFSANTFPEINEQAYLDYLNKTYGSMRTRIEPNYVYNVGEKIWAGYFQANFSTDRLRGNVGLRLVQTKQHADSTDKVHDKRHFLYRDPSGSLVPCSDPNNSPVPGKGCQGGYVKDDLNVETYAVTSVDRSYTDVLPSLNVAYDLSNNLVLRGAASKVIARPSYGDIASPGDLTYCSTQYAQESQLAGGGCIPGWSGSGSNKNLEPFRATQFDLGLEWYFHRGSVLGGALFRKNVANFAVPVVVDQPQVINGQGAIVQGFQTTAAGRNAVSQGIELYAQHTFSSGLGFQANYTYNKTNKAAIDLNGQQLGESPLTGSAKTQANLTVFYETKDLLLRASYNHRGEVVNGLSSGMTVYSDPYAQVDLNAAYNFTDHLSLTASVLNLTKAESRQHLGNDTTARLVGNYYSGRVLYTGLSYKF